MSTLEIRNISKTYKKGAVKALDNFNVVLTPGVYGLLGPNGAGKSTLMNIITDNLNSDKGEVLYDEENIKKLGKNYRSVAGVFHGLSAYITFSLHLSAQCGDRESDFSQFVHR